YIASPLVAAPYPATNRPNTENIMPMGNLISNPITVPHYFLGSKNLRHCKALPENPIEDDQRRQHHRREHGWLLIPRQPFIFRTIGQRINQALQFAIGA